MAFTHLHVHTEYSLLDGSSRIDELLSRAAELGMDSLAITDHGAMYGVIDFYKEAFSRGIKPIIGCEVYVAAGSRFTKEHSEENRYYHLILLAETNEGYHNLMKIVSAGFTEGFYYKPRVDYELLRVYHTGLIASSACLAGEVSRKIAAGDFEGAREAALRYREIFGEGSFFLELQDHGMPEEKVVNEGLVRLSAETKIPLIATNDSHYTFAEDAEAHDLLLCIQTQKKVGDTDRMRYEGGQYYLKSEEEMRSLFPYAPEAIENTAMIAARCHVEIEFGSYHLPKFPVPEGCTASQYLRKLCDDGMRRRYPEASYQGAGTGADISPAGNEITHKSLSDRLSYELETIENMGFVDYFLIVSDFIHFAKKNRIPVGPGRGSAAGSIVAYVLGITDIDPIRFSLLFERFLNPERVTMPDIDVDFCYEGRSRVIDYVVEKYGADNVAQIITFGTMAARAVVRDVGRVLDMSYQAVDRIARMIPNELNMTLERALRESPDFRSAYETDDQVRHLVDMSRRLEGLPRHASVHAAGVLIASDRVDNFVPLSRNTDGTIVTEFTMVTLEELGLLKMDFLGLRTLTVIDEAIKRVKVNHGTDVSFADGDYSDENVFKMISKGDTKGIFQLESAGMTSFMKELKPTHIEDIIAGLALFRPGPMDFIPKYLRGKENADSVVYETPLLKPILEATYGCIVYQEQVMQIVQSLAGYTLGRADILRRAMSKKKHSVMEQERECFVHGDPELGIPGCLARGISETVAQHIYDEMIDFASYAFNKSHAAAYAVISYETAWLKYYYPSEFMAALMTSVMDHTTKLTDYILTLKDMGIRLMPPDINEGEYGFTALKSGDILYGLTAIKGVGRAVVEDIVRVRREGGPFGDLEDFIDRMPQSVNKKTIEGLIKAGALDGFRGTRKQKLIMAEKLLSDLSAQKRTGYAGQITLFDIGGESFKMKLPDVGEFESEELLAFEKEATGMYLSGHPMEKYMDSMKHFVTAWSGDYLPDEETGEIGLYEGEQVVSAGIIENKKLKITKSGRQMAFLTVEDIYGQLDALLFPENFEKMRELAVEGRKVYLLGRASINRDETASLIVERIVGIEDTRKELWVAFDTREDFRRSSELLEETAFDHPGASEVVVFLRCERVMKRLGPSLKVGTSDADIRDFAAKFGAENVKTKEIGL